MAQKVHFIFSFTTMFSIAYVLTDALRHIVVSTHGVLQTNENVDFFS